MLLLMTAIGLLFAFLLVRFFAGRHLTETRSVVLHVPPHEAWELIRDFAGLHAAHHRGRPHLHIAASRPRSGTLGAPGSIIRQEGRWGPTPYWADIEIVASDPPHRVTVRLVRDSLGTHRGLGRHRGHVILRPEGPGHTKIIWRLDAWLNSMTLLSGRLLSPERVRTRLLDLGLRSLKLAVDGTPRARRATATASHMAVPQAGGFAALSERAATGIVPATQPLEGARDQL